jgi:hypothetical protein
MGMLCIGWMGMLCMGMLWIGWMGMLSGAVRNINEAVSVGGCRDNGTVP